MEAAEKLNKKFKNMPLNVFIIEVICLLEKGLTLGFFGTSGEKLNSTRKDILSLFYHYMILNADMFTHKNCEKCKQEDSGILTGIKSFALVNSYFVVFSKYVKEEFMIDLDIFSFIDYCMGVIFKEGTPQGVINDWYKSVIVVLGKYPVENDILLEDIEDKRNNSLMHTIIGRN